MYNINFCKNLVNILMILGIFVAYIYYQIIVFSEYLSYIVLHRSSTPILYWLFYIFLLIIHNMDVYYIFEIYWPNIFQKNKKQNSVQCHIIICIYILIICSRIIYNLYSIAVQKYRIYKPGGKYKNIMIILYSIKYNLISNSI